VEHYDQANTLLQTVLAKVALNRQQLAKAEHDLAVANAVLRQRVIDMYMQPQVNIIDVVVATHSFDDFVTQVTMLSKIGRSDAAVVQHVRAYKLAVATKRVELLANERAVKGLVESCQRQKVVILALQSHIQHIYDHNRALIKKIEAAQAARARALAAAAAKALKAAQEAAKRNGYHIPNIPGGGPGHPEVVAIAMRYLGVPYVWGGASPSGFDCSGLVMYVYAQIGIFLPHGATDQQRMSSPVRLDQLQPGDCVFFGGPGFSHHVGIYVGGGMMIDAPYTGTVVRYDPIGGDAWIGGRF
jgi:cell wall-associated NlpC family hydrolase